MENFPHKRLIFLQKCVGLLVGVAEAGSADLKSVFKGQRAAPPRKGGGGGPARRQAHLTREMQEKALTGRKNTLSTQQIQKAQDLNID
ncbi:hypothetical protein EYF80_037617 [Liparis tanakae]|uniref:Uncharacterized protein n=1 Tax=Liparis tanakae TaxID=230148 RepID=A0A4Z2GF97_9TELE|nr:hypothetical protein EYF80_037617 [Liparis tanakae]